MLDRYSPGNGTGDVLYNRKPSSVFIDHDTFVKQGFYSRLNQGGN